MRHVWRASSRQAHRCRRCISDCSSLSSVALAGDEARSENNRRNLRTISGRLTNRMRIRSLFALQACGFALAATTSLWSQDAAQSFESQNGLLSPQQFLEARQAFEEVETPQKGLGIHFNEASCAA